MRFDTLDGLRGVAALMVLFYHLGPGSPISAGAGYLAVDLFFGLSGFVLSRAYDQRLRDGLPPGRFMLLRLIRVYPMAAVGAGIGVLLSGSHFLSLLLVPSLTGTGALYPANVPLWSLALELVVNALFAVACPHVGRRGLAAVMVASGGLLVVGAMSHGVRDLGGFWPTAGYGLGRTTFSFALGIAMERLHRRYGPFGRVTPLAWLPPIALGALLSLLPGNNLFWDLCSVFLLLPALLWLGTIWHPARGRAMRLLGDVSFPLYCIHGVILQGFAAAGIPTQGVWVPLIAAAWWLDRRVDRPLRRWLTDALTKRDVPSAIKAAPHPSPL